MTHLTGNLLSVRIEQAFALTRARTLNEAPLRAPAEFVGPCPVCVLGRRDLTAIATHNVRVAHDGERSYRVTAA